MRLKLQHIKRLDAFPRAEEHLTQKTSLGAVVSTIGAVTILVLLLHELRYFLEVEITHEMAVDVKRGEKLPIFVNITFPSLPCNVLGLDAVDMSGKHEVDLRTNIWKLRVHKDGYVLGSEYLSDLEAKHKDHDPDQAQDDVHQILNPEKTLKDIRRALQDEEGCRVYGTLDVERVAGNFHVSMHKLSVYLAVELFQPHQVNVSHIIHHLGLGPKFPGMKNPLDGASRIIRDGSGTFKYFMKIVPTQYSHLDGSVISTNQFSVTEYDSPITHKDVHTWPAVFFVYDFSPITVTVTERRRNFGHFVTRLCAVLGGTFALTGMLDRWIYKLLQAFNSVVKEAPAA